MAFLYAYFLNISKKHHHGPTFCHLREPQSDTESHKIEQISCPVPSQPSKIINNDEDHKSTNISKIKDSGFSLSQSFLIRQMNTDDHDQTRQIKKENDESEDDCSVYDGYDNQNYTELDKIFLVDPRERCVGEMLNEPGSSRCSLDNIKPELASLDRNPTIESMKSFLEYLSTRNKSRVYDCFDQFSAQPENALDFMLKWITWPLSSSKKVSYLGDIIPYGLAKHRIEVAQVVAILREVVNSKIPIQNVADLFSCLFSEYVSLSFLVQVFDQKSERNCAIMIQTLQDARKRFGNDWISDVFYLSNLSVKHFFATDNCSNFYSAHDTLRQNGLSFLIKYEKTLFNQLVDRLMPIFRHKNSLWYSNTLIESSFSEFERSSSIFARALAFTVIDVCYVNSHGGVKDLCELKNVCKGLKAYLDGFQILYALEEFKYIDIQPENMGFIHSLVVRILKDEIGESVLTVFNNWKLRSDKWMRWSKLVSADMIKAFRERKQ